MQTVSDLWEPEIRRSHTVYSYVDVIAPNQAAFKLAVTDGSVQVDRTASVRRRCTISCVDPTGTTTPTSADSVLTPYGTEIRPYRGVKYADGTTEVVPLGVFRVSKVSVSDQVGGSPAISIEAFDLARTVSRDKFIAPYVVNTGDLVIPAIKAILARTFPDLTYDSISSSLFATAPLVFDVNADPWDAASTLADSLGCELFFDAVGTVVIAPPVDIDHLPAPDFTFVEGRGCTMLDLDVVFSDEPGFNGVVLTGESPGDELPPVRSVVWDAEPSSPTYHLGPYGEVPLFVTDQVVKTQSDADAAANAILRGLLGFSSQLSLTAIVNPALDANDVIQVKRVRSGVSGTYAIDKLTIPLSAKGTMSVEVREKRTV